MNLPRRFPRALQLLLFGFSGLLPILPTSAAVVIDWQAPQNITGDSNVSTLGTFVSAGNAGGTSVAVNGVTFAAYSAGTGNTFDANGAALTFGGGSATPWSGLSGNYKTLLGAGIYETFSTSATTSATLTLTGLTINQTYLVQFWVDDSRGDSPNRWTRFLTITGGSSTSGALDYNVQNADGGLGQFVIGTFVADATSLTFTLLGDNSAGVSAGTSTQLNAWQLRAIPEPSAALLGIGGLGVCLLMRKRRRVLH